ncbi:helix-turn-helix transcriptional regulator [Candidatus Acetothermia bacterium]|nr:helix-turn-helix transcriptional regulator [Candidatus Acetothermia bacterium]
MEDLILRRFGQRVANLRRARQWTQIELAQRTGLHRSYIAGVESGRRNVSFRNLLRLAQGLELSPEQLFTDFLSMACLN